MDSREVIRQACSDLIAGRVRPMEPSADALERAQREGVVGVLGRACATHDMVRRVAAETFAQNARYLHALAALDDSLGAGNGQALVLKGGALLHTVYRAHPSLRPLSDVDLLVRDDSIDEVLSACGFTRSGPGVWSRDQLTFDVHRHLVEGRIRSRAQAFRFDEQELWDASEPLAEFRHLRVLSPVHHFLYLAVHAVKHAHARLIWLVDLALLLPTVDLDVLLRTARTTGCHRVLAYTFACLQRLFDVPVPPLRLRLNGLERRYVDAVVRREQPAVLGEIVMVFSIPSLAGRLAYLLEVCFPRVEILRRLYPSTPEWRLPLARLAHLISMARSEFGKWVSLIFHRQTSSPRPVTIDH